MNFEEKDATAQLLDVFIDALLLAQNAQDDLVANRGVWYPTWKKLAREMERIGCEGAEEGRSRSREQHKQLSGASDVVFQRKARAPPAAAAAAATAQPPAEDDQESVFMTRKPRRHAHGFVLQKVAAPAEPQCDEDEDEAEDSEDNEVIVFGDSDPDQEEEEEEAADEDRGAQPEGHGAGGKPRQAAAKRKPRVSVHPGVTANGTTIPDDMRRLWKEERLNKLTVDRLRTYLKIQNIASTGTKAALLDRVVAKLEEEERLLTSLGKGDTLARPCATEYSDDLVHGQAQAHAPRIECGVRVAAARGMAPVGVDLEEPFLPAKTAERRFKPAKQPTADRKLRKKRTQVVDDDSDCEEAEPLPFTTENVDHVEQALRQSPNTKTHRWQARLPVPKPRTSVDTTIGVPHTPATAAELALYADYPSPLTSAGYVCPEPAPPLPNFQW